MAGILERGRGRFLKLERPSPGSIRLEATEI
ncbi:hypothetical protein FHS21_001794 [Phyllobacterium trifolii]|jgi:hypothetical protein|uniref:Uncharacterized protein n=1 Tax=Phyllobacterium trifolii TaxID=300193 RepID=A0A839UAS3_9HYPH|nr:hypothetical protein [Phyllobacterium trifolii]